VPPVLAGTDGTNHKEEALFGIAFNVPTAALRSNHWCAMRVARRLVQRYGGTEARRRAHQQKQKHVTIANHVRYVTHAFRWLYWDLVALDCNKIPEPVRWPCEVAS